MFELSTILSPVDLSDGSRSALGVARFLCKVYDASFRSTYVVPSLSPLVEQVLFPYAALGEDLPELEKELLTAAKNNLTTFFETASPDDDRTLNPHVFCAPVTKGVLEEIQRIGPDLVVMGAHGNGTRHTGQLGSTVSRVLHEWRGPTLLAKDIGGEGNLRHVVVATDFSQGSSELLRMAVGVALTAEADLTVVTVVPNPTLNDPGGLLRGVLRINDQTLLNKGRSNARQHFDRVFSEMDIPFPVREAFSELRPRLTVRYGDPCSEISRVVSALDDALLIVARAEMSKDATRGIGRTAGALAKTVPAHVLLVALPRKD